MPSREIQLAPSAPYGVGVGLLKRHKTLPHPREEQHATMRPETLASNLHILSVDTGIPSSPTSQSSSPRTLKHSSRRIGVPDLPPTPPTHSRQSSSSNTVFERIESHNEAPDSPSLPKTPTNQQSPPTPDVTPPREAVRRLVARPSGSDRYPSSRNDSFKTAREDFSSEEEDEASTVRPVLPSARPSEAEIAHVAGKSFLTREIGLGLGLESDHESTPSPEGRERASRSSASRSAKEFVTFDGEWGSMGDTSEVEREWDSNLMRNVTVRKRPARALYFHGYSGPQEVLDDNMVTPTNATKLLRRYPLLDTLSTPPLQGGTMESPSVPVFPDRSTALQPESPTTLDIRRFSALSARSGSSTVVEAMVVDTPPQRRKTLRHTKKQSGLREFSSDQSTHSSTVDSTFSEHIPRRLVHKSSGIFTRGHHSLGSSAATSTTSSAKSRRDIWANGSIPVVVVPERRSSVKSNNVPSLRSTSSRRTKRSMSLNSAPLSHSSKANDPGYFDLPKRNPRRLSESASSAAQSIMTIDFPPQIPARRSSLSAPTSCNNSRAASLTTESLKAHNRIQAEAQNDQPSPSQLPVEFQRDVVSLAPRASVDHNGDPFFGNRLSAQVTPFSQASYETTGTSAELAQATSMALYPHHNESVIVVEQQGQPPPVPQQNLRRWMGQPEAILSGINTDVPLTPPQQQLHQMDEVNSPLKNPRDAPQPPDIKFIPPTPNNLTPAHEEDRQLGGEERPSTAGGKPKRGLSLLRRALSNGRRSESTLVRTFSMKRGRGNGVEDAQPAKDAAQSSTIYPSVTDHPADESKLHPFWRPAGFWDDLEDGQYDEYDDPYSYPPIDNRPSLPKRSLSDNLKRTFAILPIRDDVHQEPYFIERRVVQRTPSGNLRVTKNRRSNDSLRRAASDGQSYYITKARKVSQETDLTRAWGSLRGLGRRMSDKRKEKRNEKIRRTISGPRDAVDGVARVIGSEGMSGLGDHGR